MITFTTTFDLRQYGSVDSFNENHYLWIVDRIVESKPIEQVGEHPLPARISSRSLLGPRRELVILHNGREYRLRLTQSGRLILTA